MRRIPFEQLRSTSPAFSRLEDLPHAFSACIASLLLTLCLVCVECESEAFLASKWGRSRSLKAKLPGSLCFSAALNARTVAARIYHVLPLPRQVLTASEFSLNARVSFFYSPCVMLQEFLLKRTAGLSAIARAGPGKVLADPDARGYALAVLDELNFSTPVAFKHKEKGAAAAAMSLLAPSALQVCSAAMLCGAFFLFFSAGGVRSRRIIGRLCTSEEHA